MSQTTTVQQESKLDKLDSDYKQTVKIPMPVILFHA